MTNKTILDCFNAGLTRTLGGQIITDRTMLDGWITVHPNGAGTKGVPVLLGPDGTVQGGMGGKFNGQHISQVGGGSGNTRVTAAQKFATETVAKSRSRLIAATGGKLTETAAQKEIANKYIDLYVERQAAILKQFEQDRQNNPSWAVTGRENRTIKTSKTPMERLAERSKELDKIESDMMSTLNASRPASSVTAEAVTKSKNAALRAIAQTFKTASSGLTSLLSDDRNAAVKAVKQLVKIDPNAARAAISEMNTVLIKQGSSIEKLFGNRLEKQLRE